jgi:hypothetical protein
MKTSIAALPKPKTSCKFMMYWPVWVDNINTEFQKREFGKVEWVRQLSNTIQWDSSVKTVTQI